MRNLQDGGEMCMRATKHSKLSSCLSQRRFQDDQHAIHINSEAASPMPVLAQRLEQIQPIHALCFIPQI